MTDIELSFEHCRRDSEYYRYQRYYLQGFRISSDVRIIIQPLRSRWFTAAREAGIPKISKGFDLLSHLLKPRNTITSDYAGRYVVNKDGTSKKIVIDSHDTRGIVDEDAYRWSDTYFKANYWPNIQYPEKTRPVVNGNGFLNDKKLLHMKSLRNVQKTVDLAFISRVWAGKGEHFWEGLEHHVRLFEALARTGGSKVLRALIPGDLKKVDISRYLRRLEAVMVPYSFEFFPSDQLWQVLAKSKVVFLRSGKHLCIPWRMIDLLCMGSCVAFDAAPFPQWPEPLRSGVNFLDCGLTRDVNERSSPVDEYEKIPKTIASLLRDEQLMESVRLNNISYFEHYASPQRVAEYILATIYNN